MSIFRQGSQSWKGLRMIPQSLPLTCIMLPDDVGVDVGSIEGLAEDGGSIDHGYPPFWFIVQEIGAVFFVEAAEGYGEVVVGFEEVSFHDISEEAGLFHLRPPFLSIARLRAST